MIGNPDPVALVKGKEEEERNQERGVGMWRGKGEGKEGTRERG